MSAKLPTPTLETDRFTMRAIERGDAAALFPTLSSEEHCQYMLSEAFSTLEKLEDWLFDPDWNGRTWVAVDRKNDEVVARIVAMPHSEATSEIGYVTAQHRHGEGIASECTARLIDYLFEDEGHHRLQAGTDPRNEASNAVLRRLGFRREAHYVESVKTHLGWCDEYFWGLLAREWESAR